MLAYAALGNGADANAPGCTIACYNDSGCNDAKPETIDVCNNDGTCEAKCVHLPQPESEEAVIIEETVEGEQEAEEIIVIESVSDENTSVVESEALFENKRG